VETGEERPGSAPRAWPCGDPGIFVNMGRLVVQVVHTSLITVKCGISIRKEGASMRRQHRRSNRKPLNWSAVFGSPVLGGFVQAAHAATFDVGTCKTGKSDCPAVQPALMSAGST
jgi:hypothetical protein